MKKSDLLKETIKHIDIKSFDSTQIINAMSGMSLHREIPLLPPTYTG